VTRSFVTLVATPPAVQLSAPADGATGIALTATLNWTPIASAQTYQLQVSPGSAFSTNIVNVSGLAGSNYTTPALTANTLYFWRVRGANAAGAGTWSAAQSFRTLVVLTRPNRAQDKTQDWVFFTVGTGSLVSSPGSGSAAARVNIATAASNIQLYQQG
jgi:hypothetical protein